MPSFLKFSLKIKNLSVQLYLFPVVFFTQQLCFKIFVPPVGKHDQVQKSWYHLQEVSGSLQILNLLKWPSKLLYKSKDSVQASIPSVQAWNKMVQTLHSGCVSAVSMGEEDGITSPAQSTQGKDWAQQEAAQASGWGSQIKSRDQARTERVQMAQSTQEYSGPSCRPLSRTCVSPLPHLNLVEQSGIFHWISVEFG